MKNVKTIVKNLKKSLRNKGFISTAKRTVTKIKRTLLPVRYLKKEYYDDDLVHIAFYPIGGLGDFIISKAVLEDVIELAAGRCVITLFCDKDVFGKAIYRDEVSEIKEYYRFDSEFYRYDLSICVEHFIHIEAVKDRIREITPVLYERIMYIKNNWDKLYIDIPDQWTRERMQFERCGREGIDRWTEQRMDKAFPIADYKVKIPLDDSYGRQFEEELTDVEYITINYGTDAIEMGKRQLKMWTVDGYERLIQLIKDEYSDIKVVQLGASNNLRIKGVDKFILGQSIEYVKHIIKHSICHIDCEGGLVHLATQLGTKCIVLFGPTPVHMYGYKQNINIVSDVCNNCMGMTENWAYKCSKGYEEAICMKGILPEIVFSEFKKIMKERKVTGGL